jgi:hypothetical protein
MKREQVDMSTRISVVFPLILTIITILANVWLQYQTSKSTESVIKYEREFNKKYKSYSSFMSAVIRSHKKAMERDNSGVVEMLYRIEEAYFHLEPFLGNEDKKKVWDKIQDYSIMCLDISEKTNNSASDTKLLRSRFIKLKDYFKTTLDKALFE